MPGWPLLPGGILKYTQRSVATAICAAAVAAGLFVTTSVELPVHLAANTALVMGGNSNPQGVTMNTELNGYISTTKPGTPYHGYDYSTVVWSAQIPFTGGSDGMTYDESQAEGLDAISTAVTAAYSPDDKLLVVGYSSSAAVVTKYLRKLQAERAAGTTTPSPENLTFILIGNPNRPNGGVLARFPGLRIGAPVGATFDGGTPGTEYTVTDISWQYDGISDFPNYTSNMLAVANAMVGFFTLHGQYYTADPTDSSQILSDRTVNNTRYITLRGDLPLLAPLYLLGVPRPLLAGLDTALRTQIERGYDRTISPDTATAAQSRPTPAPTPTVTSSQVSDAPAVTAGTKKAAVADVADSDDRPTTTPTTTATSPTSTASPAPTTTSSSATDPTPTTTSPTVSTPGSSSSTPEPTTTSGATPGTAGSPRPTVTTQDAA